MTVKYFKYAFADSGIVLPVPNPTQVDNTVSYQQGFSANYALIDTDPSSLNIPLNQYNQLMNDITGALQQVQQNGFPIHITSAMNDGSPYAYSINSFVRATDNNVYYSLINANTDVPPTANWQILAIGEGAGTLYLNYAVDTGIANAYATAPMPAITSYQDGQVVILNPAHANTGASTISVNGLPTQGLVTPTGAALGTGMLIPSSEYILICKGANFVVTNPTLPTTVTAFQKIVIQKFLSNGTYTPTVGMLYCDVQMVAGGAGAGKAQGTGTNGGGSGGAGAGEYARSVISAATIGASQAVTVGLGGAGASAPFDTNGNAGGDSSLGSLVIAKGGSPSNFADGSASPGGAGGTGGTGQVLIDGGAGQDGAFSTAAAANPNYGGQGGSSQLGAGGQSTWHGAGKSGQLYGSGAGGASALYTDGGTAGGNGATGIVIITEYCSA